MMVLRRMSMLGGASSAMFLNMRSANCLSTECAPGKLRVAVVQMRVVGDKASNIAHCRVMLNKACDTGAQLVVLPEVWNSEYAVSAFRANAEPVSLGRAADGESTSLLREVALERGVWIVGGSVPELADDRVFNTATVVDASGSIVAKHRKAHLFDIDVPGKIRFFESETLSAGAAATVTPLPEALGGGALGVAICYDMRFAELAIAMRGKGATVLVYPGAFNTVTGPLHWELLARARALDSQAFVVAASPARNLEASYHAYGHSVVVDPWGAVCAQAQGTDEEILLVDLDLGKVTEVRAAMRLWDQRRPDIYDLGTNPSAAQ